MWLIRFHGVLGCPLQINNTGEPIDGIIAIPLSLFPLTHRHQLLKICKNRRDVSLAAVDSIAGGSPHHGGAQTWMGVPLSIICSGHLIEMDKPHYFGFIC